MNRNRILRAINVRMPICMLFFSLLCCPASAQSDASAYSCQLLLEVAKADSLSSEDQVRHVREALQCATDMNDPVVEGQIVLAAIEYYLRHRFFDEARELLDYGARVPEMNRNSVYTARHHKLRGYLFSIKNDNSKALKSFESGVDAARKANDVALLASLHNNKAVMLYQLSRYAESFEAYDQAIGLYEGLFAQTQDQKWLLLLTSSQRNFAINLKEVGQYDRALVMYLDALRVFKAATQNDRIVKEIAVTLAATGNLHRHIGNHDLAISFLEDALELREQLRDSSGIAIIRNNIGNVYRENLGDLDLAQENYERSLEINRKMDQSGPGMNGYIATNLDNLGSVAFARQDYTNAESFFKEALQIRTRLSDLQGIGATCNALAALYLDKQPFQPDTARAYLNKGRQTNKEADAMEALLENHALSKRYFERIGRYQDAYLYAESYSHLKDSLFNAEKASILTETQVAFDVEQKDHEIELLKLTDIQKERAYRQRLLVTGGTLVLFIIIAGLLFYLYRLKQRLNKELTHKTMVIQQTNLRLEEERDQVKLLAEEKTILMQEIHHRVKNFLASLSAIFSLQRDALRSSKESGTLDMLRSSEARIDAMNALHQELYDPDSYETTGTKVKVREYLRKLVGKLLGSYTSESLDIRLEYDVDDLIMDVSKVLPLSIVVTELTTNAIKAMSIDPLADKTRHLGITLTKTDNDHYELSVIGSGRPFPSTSWLKMLREGGFGLRMVDLFVKQLYGEIQIREVRNGSVVRLMFPIEQ